MTPIFETDLTNIPFKYIQRWVSLKPSKAAGWFSHRRSNLINKTKVHLKTWAANHLNLKDPWNPWQAHRDFVNFVCRSFLSEDHYFQLQMGCWKQQPLGSLGTSINKECETYGKQQAKTSNTWLIWWFFLLSNVSFLENDSIISGVLPPSVPVKRPGKFGNSVRLWFVIDPEVPLTGWTHKSARGWNVYKQTCRDRQID